MLANAETIPVVWLSKTDLVYVQPDHAQAIEGLTETEMEQIAKTVSDALQDMYHIALEHALIHHLGLKHSDAL